MFLATEAILLKKIPQTGNGYIIKTLTKERGIKTYFTRKTKKEKGLLQALTILHIAAYEDPKKNIQNIKEISISHPYLNISSDIIKSNIAIFLNEILDKILIEEEANQLLFDFIKQELITFDTTELNLDFHTTFLMKLTKHLGFVPTCDGDGYFDFEEGAILAKIPLHDNYLKKEETLLFKELFDFSFSNKAFISNNSKRKKQLELILHYYQFHVDLKNMKSLPILQMIFN